MTALGDRYAKKCSHTLGHDIWNLTEQCASCLITIMMEVSSSPFWEKFAFLRLKIRACYESRHHFLSTHQLVYRKPKTGSIPICMTWTTLKVLSVSSWTIRIFSAGRKTEKTPETYILWTMYWRTLYVITPIFNAQCSGHKSFTERQGRCEVNINSSPGVFTYWLTSSHIDKSRFQERFSWLLFPILLLILKYCP